MLLFDRHFFRIMPVTCNVVRRQSFTLRGVERSETGARLCFEFLLTVPLEILRNNTKTHVQSVRQRGLQLDRASQCQSARSE
jgi:hypothetical protein